jgi:hypothetical protein
MLGMLKEAILLGIGAIFGLGAALMSAAAPLYAPNAPLWVWHWTFWGGVTLMVLMLLDLYFLLVWDSGPRFLPVILINIGLCTAASGLVMHYSTPPGIITENAKKAKVQMARRWIHLANDITADLPLFAGRIPPSAFVPNLSAEQRHALWVQEVQRSTEDFQANIVRIRAKYVGRLAQARDEMRANNISIENALGQELLNMTNSFSFQRWVEKLESEGRKILTEAGEDEN